MYDSENSLDSCGTWIHHVQCACVCVCVHTHNIHVHVCYEYAHVHVQCVSVMVSWFALILQRAQRTYMYVHVASLSESL